MLASSVRDSETISGWGPSSEPQCFPCWCLPLRSGSEEAQLSGSSLARVEVIRGSFEFPQVAPVEASVTHPLQRLSVPLQRCMWNPATTSARTPSAEATSRSGNVDVEAMFLETTKRQAKIDLA